MKGHRQALFLQTMLVCTFALPSCAPERNGLETSVCGIDPAAKNRPPRARLSHFIYLLPGSLPALQPSGYRADEYR